MTSHKKPSINHKSVERFENEGGTTRAGELSRKKRRATPTISPSPSWTLPRAKLRIASPRRKSRVKPDQI
jgi:hypothetical protein